MYSIQGFTVGDLQYFVCDRFLVVTRSPQPLVRDGRVIIHTQMATDVTAITTLAIIAGLHALAVPTSVTMRSVIITEEAL